MKKLLLSLLLAGFAFSASYATVQDFTLVDTKGKSHNLFTYLKAGKAVVLDLWFNGCGNCAAAASKLDKIYKDYGSNTKNVIVIGLQIKDQFTNADIEAWKAQYGATYPGCGGTPARNYWSSAMYPTYGGSFGQFFVICPNTTTPANSQITWSKTASSLSTTDQTALKAALAGCGFNPSAVEDNTLDNASFSLFPNPAQDNFTVEFNCEKNIDATLEIFSVLGARVMNPISCSVIHGMNRISVNTSGLPGGLYLVAIKSKENGSRFLNVQIAK